MQAVALQVVVAAMMISVGLELSPGDLAEGPRRIRAFTLAVLANLVAFPLLAWGLCAGLGVSDAFLAGMVLLAAAPGAPAAPMFARLGGAHLGFSTALTVALGVLTLVAGPLIVGGILGAEGVGERLVWPIIRTLALFQVLPLVLAMSVRRLRPDWAASAARPLARLSNALLALVVLAVMVAEPTALLRTPLAAHLAVFAAVAGALLPGVLVRDRDGVVRGAALVTSMRNVSVGLLLAQSFFTDPDTSMAVMVGGVWMLVLPAAAAWRWGRDVGPQTHAAEGRPRYESQS